MSARFTNCVSLAQSLHPVFNIIIASPIFLEKARQILARPQVELQ